MFTFKIKDLNSFTDNMIKLQNKAVFTFKIKDLNSFTDNMIKPQNKMDWLVSYDPLFLLGYLTSGPERTQGIVNSARFILRW